MSAVDALDGGGGPASALPGPEELVRPVMTPQPR
jgi:hypothetical protein